MTYAYIYTHLPPNTFESAESVVVGPQGQLVMLDRSNQLWEARQDPANSRKWALSAEPLKKLGPGRPLGYHFDAQGNLIICNSLLVRGKAGLEKYAAVRVGVPCTWGPKHLQDC